MAETPCPSHTDESQRLITRNGQTTKRFDSSWPWCCHLCNGAGDRELRNITICTFSNEGTWDREQSKRFVTDAKYALKPHLW